MSKPAPPCKGCERRSVGCHSSCSQYKTYQTDSQTYKQSVIAQTLGGQLADSVAYRTKRKNWKAKHVPGGTR